VVLRSSLDCEEALTRFAREISLLKAMNHPFVAELFEIIEDAGSFYLVMELLEHGNMLEYVNGHGRLNEDQARRYFCEIISALDYLHNWRFVAHRDLKAENILLDRHNNVRLIDFSLSKQFSKAAPTLVTACGSPAYAAPEMIQGHSYTKAADIWSAGVCLFAMVAGHLPFEYNSRSFRNPAIRLQANLGAFAALRKS
jgi:serine/threonine protein kinase